jgi:hypothetical protein
MFLPDYIESGFDHAYLKSDSGTTAAVKEKLIVYESRPEDLPRGLPHPLYVFGGLMVLGVFLTFRDWKRKKTATWFDVLLFGVCGLIGLLLFFLWFATDHQAAAKNLNLLWAIPTHVIAVLAFIKNPRWLSIYFLIVALTCLVLLGTWFILPQQLNTALIPVVIVLGARSFIQYILRKNTIAK